MTEQKTYACQYLACGLSFDDYEEYRVHYHTFQLCECGHGGADHRSIPPYHCQHGMGTGPADCECPTFREENKERLDAEYDAQRYEDWKSRYE